MLEPSDKKKLDDYLDKIFDDLKKNIESLKKNNRYSDKELREKVVSITVNKITPESKVILSSTYNMLESNTFKEDCFNDTTNKAKFYKLCILEDITKKINFELPKEINKQQGINKINKINKMSFAISAGSILSIIKNSPYPVLISVLIMALMDDYIQKNSNKKTNKDSDKVIEEYLDSVRKFLDNLIKDIVSYYDERIEELKREIHQKSK